jgi:hypothetical protein
MSLPILDSTTPGKNRSSRNTTHTIGNCTAVAATDLFTLTSGSLDSLETGDVVRIAGTLTGGVGITAGTAYYLLKVSSTTFKLRPAQTGAFLDVTSDLTAGGSLTYGDLDPNDCGFVLGNIVAQNSVAGGGGAGADPYS